MSTDIAPTPAGPPGPPEHAHEDGTRCMWMRHNFIDQWRMVGRTGEDLGRCPGFTEKEEPPALAWNDSLLNACDIAALTDFINDHRIAHDNANHPNGHVCSVRCLASSIASGWLAEHDRRERAEALRDAADALYDYHHTPKGRVAKTLWLLQRDNIVQNLRIKEWLRARADRLYTPAEFDGGA